MRIWRISAIVATGLLLVVGTYAVTNAVATRANSQYPFGTGYMMGGYGGGMMGQGMGSGYMGDFGMMGTGFGSSSAAEPMSIDDARTSIEGYLARMGEEDLEIGEIMVFSNHAYAQLLESDSGMGAFEVLVDPVTGAVHPEPGPSMMWNTKYSPMMGSMSMGMMGGSSYGAGQMMGGFAAGSSGMGNPIGEAEAVATAQRFLDVYAPDAQAETTADSFYGYYTIHVLRDGETIGMLSVNAYTMQVYYHGWHGAFIEASS